MFCPKCKAEYRPGFIRCSDCDIDLVDELSTKQLPSDLKIVWRGSQSDCLDACRELQDAGITYEVVQVVVGPAPSMGVESRYEIKVSGCDVNKAKEVLGTALTVEASQIVDQGAFELPENPTLSTPESERRALGFRRWHPADAVVEVWCQCAEDPSLVAELSLNTNLIPFRIETREDGTRKFFVTRDDESIAREILRQIRDGTPPT